MNEFESERGDTLLISARGGYDSDCNPSSACGILFTSLGEKAIPARYKEALDKTRKWEFTDYAYPQLLAVCEKLTRDIVVREGGRIEKDAAGCEWYRNQVPEALKTQYSFGMRVDPARHTIGHGGAYATCASADSENRSCSIFFVQKW